MMPVRVIIPTPLRPYAGRRDHVEVAAKTVGEALASLIREHGELRRHLYQDDGRLRSFVNVYVNDEDIRYLQREATPVHDGDTVSIVPSIAGGSTGTLACALVAGTSRASRNSCEQSTASPETSGGCATRGNNNGQ
jgi:adenylyltransferase/sulfurtransferase